MKVLLTGVNGYVGRNLALALIAMGYEVCGIGRKDRAFDDRVGYMRGDVTDPIAVNELFSRFSPEVVVHAAALVHDQGKDQPESEFMRVNADSTELLARKAIAAGVKRFIFMSTVAVYGIETGTIDAHTPLRARTPYGKSKLEAERRLTALFSGEETAQSRRGGDRMPPPVSTLLILRCPMIYGPGCPGNYRTLRKIALKLPAVPDVDNARSLLFIGNLCAYVTACLKADVSGILAPQDPAYINTSAMMAAIRTQNGKRANRSRLLGGCVRLAMFLPQAQKAFGSLTLDHRMADIGTTVDLLDFETCMTNTECN